MTMKRLAKLDQDEEDGDGPDAGHHGEAAAAVLDARALRGHDEETLN